MVYVPRVARLLTLIVIVVEEAVVLLGLKLTLVRLGTPDALKVIAELNPFSLVTVIVELRLEPRVIVRLLGLADKVNPGVGAGFTVNCACRAPPP